MNFKDSDIRALNQAWRPSEHVSLCDYTDHVCVCVCLKYIEYYAWKIKS